MVGADPPRQAPLLEATGLGAVQWASGEAITTLAYGGDLRFAPGQTIALEDFHQIDGALGRRASVFSVAVEAQASAAGDPWLSVLLGPRVNTGLRGPARAELLVGVEGRDDATRRAAALSATSQAELHLNPRAQLRGHLELRQFLAAPALGSASIGLGWSPRPTITARLDLGVKGSWGADPDPWADQVGPSAAAGWATLGLDLGLARGLRTGAELSLWRPLDADGATALIARAALGWRLVGQVAPDRAPDRTLKLLAPSAASVLVIGSFTDWQPREMERQPDGTWTLNVTLSPGVHSYMYLVDDQPVTPPDAPLVVEDDFGLQQGVIVVSAAP